MASHNIIEAILGPGFIGYTLSLSLYGVTLAQSVYYFQVFQADGRATRMLVLSVCTLDTFHVYVLSHMFWNTLIHGRIESLLSLIQIPWQLPASFITQYFVSTLVQGFFCLRVWRISGRNMYLTAIIAVTTAASFATGMVFAAHTIRNSSPFSVFDATANPFVRAQLITSMVADITISAALSYYFNTFRVGLKRTKAVLQQLIFLTVNMGLLLWMACLLYYLSMVTVLALILFELKTGGEFSSLAPNIIISKLYINSLMATLNTRKHLRDLAHGTGIVTLSSVANAPTTSMPAFRTGSTSLPKSDDEGMEMDDVYLRPSK